MTDIVQRCQHAVAKLPPWMGNLLEYSYYSVWIRVVNPSYCLVSYPKCGRTWLRYLLANYIVDAYDTSMESRLYRMASDRFPSIMATHDGKMVTSVTASKTRYEGRKVIFLVRDPRDVLVSHYHHKKDRNNSFDEGLASFAHHPTLGIENIIEYLNKWYEEQSVPEDFLLVRYEDMKEDIERDARRVLSFLGEDVDDDALQDAIEASRFSNMKQAEEEGGAELSGLSSSDDGDGRKVRKGVKHGYVDEMDESTLTYVDDCVRESLNDGFGYD